MKNPLTVRREKLGLTQQQMAVLLKTVQSEVSKSEAGELPENIGDWAKAYRTTKPKFKRECEAARWALPLWKYAVTTPREIEVIDCTAGRGYVAENHPEIVHARRIAQ